MVNRDLVGVMASVDFKRNVTRVGVILICVVSFSACMIYPEKHSVFASIGMTDHFTVRRHGNFVLPMTASFYIPIPVVKVQSPSIDSLVLESAVEFAFNALAARFASTAMGSHPESFEDSFSSAADQQCAYVFYLEFIEFHDAVGFPARPQWQGPGGIDRIHFKVLLAEVKTRQIIDSIDIQSESGWSSFVGDRPVQLLKMPLRNISALLSSQWH